MQQNYRIKTNQEIIPLRNNYNSQIKCVLNNNKLILKSSLFVDVEIDLSKKPLTLDLVEVFMMNPNSKVTMEEILHSLYDTSKFSLLSTRYLNSLHTNMIKLISRTRLDISSKIEYTNGDVIIKWFYFEDGSWFFYKLFKIKNLY